MWRVRLSTNLDEDLERGAQGGTAMEAMSVANATRAAKEHDVTAHEPVAEVSGDG